MAAAGIAEQLKPYTNPSGEWSQLGRAFDEQVFSLIFHAVNLGFNEDYSLCSKQPHNPLTSKPISVVHPEAKKRLERRQVIRLCIERKVMPSTSNNPLDLLVWMCRQVVEFIKDILWFCQSEQTKASEVLAEQLREITSDCPPENQAVIQKLADGILMGLCLSYESRVYTGDFIYYGRTPFFIRNYVELALHQHTKSSHAFTHRIKQAFNLS